MSEQNNENVQDDLIGEVHEVVDQENVVNVSNINDVDMEEEDDDDYDYDYDDDDEDWDIIHPLRRAIRRDEAEDVILQLIDLYPDVVKEIDNDRGEYLLHKACRCVRSDAVVMKLMEIFPLAITQQNIKGNYPLHMSCDYYQSDFIILALIEVFPTAVQQHNNKGRFPFHIACINSDQSDNVALQLIEVFPEVAFFNSTKIDDKIHNHGFALHMAIERRQFEEVIRKLIEINPLAVCERDCDGDYPIHKAIWTRRSTTLIGLIMDIDPLTIYRENNFGITPFHCACHYNAYDLMDYMIQNNSIMSINFKNEGATALHCACWKSGQNYEAVHLETLLRYPGIDVNVLDNTNETPLHKSALFQTEIHAFEKLLDHPLIDINSKNNDNKTPLDLLQGRKMELLSRVTIPDDDADENKLQLYNRIENLFEDFATKRRWHAYCYYSSIP